MADTTDDIKIPTLNRFRKSTTTGIDYTNPGKPGSVKLKISNDGISDREAEIHLARLKNQANEWNVIKAEAEVHTAKNNAHAALFKAMESEVNAASALTNAQISYHDWEIGQAKLTVKEGERNLAVASVDLQLRSQELELDKLRYQVREKAMGVNQLRDDVIHQQTMNQLNGYDIKVEIPVPTFSRPQKQTVITTPASSIWDQTPTPQQTEPKPGKPS